MPNRIIRDSIRTSDSRVRHRIARIAETWITLKGREDPAIQEKVEGYLTNGSYADAMPTRLKRAIRDYERS